MQGCKLFVGNISYSNASDDLRELFSSYGEVCNVDVFEERDFALVEMSSPSEAEKAKKALDGTVFKGRTLNID